MKLNEFRFRLIDRENGDSIVIGFNDLVPYEGESNDIYITPYDKNIPKKWRLVSVLGDSEDIDVNITIEQSIDALSDSGWLKNHDKEIREDGFAKGVESVILPRKLFAEKPIRLPMEGFDSEVASQLVCPNCNKPIVNVWNTDKYKPNYCHYCGQKFDWSEENKDNSEQKSTLSAGNS